MICPKCKEDRAHRSHRSGIKDSILHFFNQIPYRCHSCNSRFYAYRAGESSSRLRTHEEMKIMQLRRRLRWKRSKRELAAYAIATAVLVCIIYFTLQQRVG